MASRARRIAIAVPEDASPNTVCGQSKFDPIPSPLGGPTLITDSDVTVGGVYFRIALTEAGRGLEDEAADRASRALRYHLELIDHTEGWKPIGAPHEHPQLESEPDD